tara:strand:+ start:171 stop:1235 length:1065 start_codon:yes stop_codon:yes gene_type:complete
VRNDISINSHKGLYKVHFLSHSLKELTNHESEDSILIIDELVLQAYKKQLTKALKRFRYITITANEKNKSLEKFPEYINKLVSLGVRRGQPLIAIGGGVIQDITCFLASTLMRGLPWVHYPTTLLAQADSCIGSKSSINSGSIKNILGTFYPPKRVCLDVSLLETLSKDDIRSGIGEMIKVHAIDSPISFDRLNNDYHKLLENNDWMEKYIYESLMIKKNIIEQDEFDEGIRNVMNYGHSFGHAIETATKYSIPHGIAVTIGMDMANFVSYKLGISEKSHFERMHAMLNNNISNYRKNKISSKLILDAIVKDKKNTSTELKLILPDQDGLIQICLQKKNKDFDSAVEKYCSIYQ